MLLALGSFFILFHWAVNCHRLWRIVGEWHPDSQALTSDNLCGCDLWIHTWTVFEQSARQKCREACTSFLLVDSDLVLFVFTTSYWARITCAVENYYEMLTMCITYTALRGFQWISACARISSPGFSVLLLHCLFGWWSHLSSYDWEVVVKAL